MVLTMLLLSLLTLLVVLAGFGVMVKGGEFNKKYGNRLMQLRVVLQGATLLVLLILILGAKH